MNIDWAVVMTAVLLQLAAAVVTMALAVVTINRLFWKRFYRLAEERFSLTT